MSKTIGIGAAMVVALGAAVWLVAASLDRAGGELELLNVSYDPTRELWRDLNSSFIPHYEKESGKKVTFRQSHGGSSSQARAVIDGLEADVVTLALFSDTDAIRRRGLLAENWANRLPNHSLPYFSTIVFVVRKGNPKQVKDWPDLKRPDIQIITPNPKTSGNGKLSFLAAWGSVIHAGGSEEQAREFTTNLYQRIPVLDTGARGATSTFAQKKIGDVHLTWENEAYLEVGESRGELEIVYPKASIKAEPYVALVDANVKKKGTQAIAEAYLKFLYTDAAQEIIARHHYRPIGEQAQAKHASELRPIALFPVTLLAADWNAVQAKFFADGGIFDRIHRPAK